MYETAKAERPKDGKEDYNWIALGHDLEKFVAHGLRPSRLLEGANPARAEEWMRTEGAILAVPLDAAYNEENACNFQTNMEIFIERAFPDQTKRVRIIPPFPAEVGKKNYGQYAQPWGFLVQGLNPPYADLLVNEHLWICRKFGFIAIDLKLRPTTFVASLIGMSKRLKDEEDIVTAVQDTIVDTNGLFLPFLAQMDMTSDQVMDIVDSVQATPRGYALNGKDTADNINEKRKPTTDSAVTMWEIHVQPPLSVLTDTRDSLHDEWIQIFKSATFKPNERYRGSENGQSQTPTSPLRLRGGRDPKTVSGQIQIAALNIKGANSNRTKKKWTSITNMMINHKIAIMAVSETHTDGPLAENLEHRHKDKFHILHSHDPDHTRANGVALIINKNMIRNDPEGTTDLIPGRALMTTVEWPAGIKNNIIAVYAPNINGAGTNNANFWNTLATRTNGLPVNIILGDFNVVEESLDRFPPHRDVDSAVNALKTLMEDKSLEDGWCLANPPPTTNFTFGHTLGTHLSRIDRIYTSGELYNKALTWSIENSDLPTTDHQMIMVTIHDQKSPYIGKGRWAIPDYLINDETFLTTVEEYGRNTLKEIEESEPPTHGRIQAKFPNFLRETVNLARKLAKAKSRKINSTLARLEKRRNKAIAQLHVNAHHLEEKQYQIMALTERIREVENTKQARNSTTASMNRKVYAESINKYWCNWGKDKKPRDTIHEMKIPQSNPTQYTTDSSEMATLAADYYNSVQLKDLNATPPEERETQIKQHLSNLQHISDTTAAPMTTLISYEEVAQALKQSQTEELQA
ncbi:Endonuclease/exonuclease/phosphatase [Cantharellus anzutake]|uniref:Endonuclease/exonuclease/phosphatase n=1 Tax=Cantharellus anzutake TaxID=1750568 RepID=UPI001907E5BC|nr:Endonuclease/exonuclease/phosphatase [Cantharellus anzutake]KAF8317002.1 Endonuclease/exonuclease/phosphatase [Cantharellus anzutake]